MRNQTVKILAGNLPLKITGPDLDLPFAAFGAVVSVTVIDDKRDSSRCVWPPVTEERKRK